MFKNNLNVSQKIENRAIIEELRQYIRLSMDCSETRIASLKTCTATTSVALKRPNPGAPDVVQIPVGKTYTKIGKFNLKAECLNNPFTYNVSYSTTPEVATSWNELFKIPIVCP